MAPSVSGSAPSAAVRMRGRWTGHPRHQEERQGGHSGHDRYRRAAGPLRASTNPATAGPTRLAAPSVHPVMTLAAVNLVRCADDGRQQSGLGAWSDEPERGQAASSRQDRGCMDAHHPPATPAMVVACDPVAAREPSPTHDAARRPRIR